MSLLLARLTTGGPVTYTYAASGGIVLSGAAAVLKQKSVTPSGGLLLSGVAAVSKGKAYTVAGGLTFSGSALVARVKAFIATGGVAFSGSAALSKGKTVQGSGGATFSGSATTSFTPGASGPNTYDYLASGGLAFSGAALTSLQSGEERVTPTVETRWRIIPHGLPSTRTYRGQGSIRVRGAARTAFRRARPRQDDEREKQIAKEMATELIHQWERERDEEELMSLAFLLD